MPRNQIEDSEIRSQRDLWDRQHASRGNFLENSDVLKNTPNGAAVELAQRLDRPSTILEIGAANGRDARFWASLGHRVLALDFSQVALEQLKFLAMQQGVVELVTPLLWDISCGQLPLAGIPNSIDAFYARSALHVDDYQLFSLAHSINMLLVPGGKVVIEGKGPNDKKIARSHIVGRSLAVDPEEHGHLRRVWTCKFARKLCETMKWDVLSLSDKREKWNGTEATFMHLVAQKGY